METLVATRSVAGAGVALALVLGGWTASSLTQDTAAAAAASMAKRVDPEQARREALDREATYRDTAEFFQIRVDEAVEHYGVEAPSLARLRQPNTFFHVATPGAPRVIEPDTALRKSGFEIRVRTEDIQVERRGMRVKNTHTLALVRNGGDKPLAYFLRMRSREGECELRALTRYDAMVLMPGEEAEISVCAGAHAVEVTDLRLMEVTDLGAIWVSKVPPQAVGHDDVGAHSHFPGNGIEMCAEIPAVEFSARIAAGETKWEDIVDFYSRHDCESYRWWPGYRRIVEPLAELPALPESQ